MVWSDDAWPREVDRTPINFLFVSRRIYTYPCENCGKICRDQLESTRDQLDIRLGFMFNLSNFVTVCKYGTRGKGVYLIEKSEESIAYILNQSKLRWRSIFLWLGVLLWTQSIGTYSSGPKIFIPSLKKTVRKASSVVSLHRKQGSRRAFDQAEARTLSEGQIFCI